MPSTHYYEFLKKIMNPLSFFTGKFSALLNDTKLTPYQIRQQFFKTMDEAQNILEHDSQERGALFKWKIERRDNGYDALIGFSSESCKLYDLFNKFPFLKDKISVAYNMMQDEKGMYFPTTIITITDQEIIKKIAQYDTNTTDATQAKEVTDFIATEFDKNVAPICASGVSQSIAATLFAKAGILSEKNAKGLTNIPYITCTEKEGMTIYCNKQEDAEKLSYAFKKAGCEPIFHCCSNLVQNRFINDHPASIVIQLNEVRKVIEDPAICNLSVTYSMDLFLKNKIPLTGDQLVTKLQGITKNYPSIDEVEKAKKAEATLEEGLDCLSDAEAKIFVARFEIEAKISEKVDCKNSLQFLKAGYASPFSKNITYSDTAKIYQAMLQKAQLKAGIVIEKKQEKKITTPQPPVNTINTAGFTYPDLIIHRENDHRLYVKGGKATSVQDFMEQVRKKLIEQVREKIKERQETYALSSPYWNEINEIGDFSNKSLIEYHLGIGNINNEESLNAFIKTERKEFHLLLR